MGRHKERRAAEARLQPSVFARELLKRLVQCDFELVRLRAQRVGVRGVQRVRLRRVRLRLRSQLPGRFSCGGGRGLLPRLFDNQE